MSELRRTLGVRQLFSFAFGTIVGVGWIVLLGEWLKRGGPMGTLLGFALGGILMALIGLCYSEAAGMWPITGGEMVFGLNALGRATGFAAGWAIVLVYGVATGYCASTLAWVLGYLVPGLEGPPLYSFRGTAVHAGSLAVALSALALLTFINLRSVKSSGRFQDGFTYGKIAVSLVFIAAGVLGGSSVNLEPLFNTEHGQTAPSGVIAVMTVVPWFLGGFNLIPQLMEERAEGLSVALAGRVTVFAILAGTVYYCLVILSASMALPWRELMTTEMPAAAAFRLAFHSEWLARLVLLTGLFGVSTVANSSMVAASRMLFSMSRSGMIAPQLAAADPATGIPHRAVLFTAVVGALLTLLGRQGIFPIVAVGSIAMSFGYLVTSAVVLRLRKTEPQRERPYRIPAGTAVSLIATVGSALLIVAAVRDPWVSAGGNFPLEWMLLLGWCALGAVLYRRAKR